MKIFYFLLLLSLINLFAQCGEPEKKSLYPNDAIQLSQDFLLAIKTDQPYQVYRDTLSDIDLEKLSKDLESADEKLVFWINVYNSLVQAKIRDDASQFDDKEKFFKEQDQIIGGIHLSLDEIENGILRRKPQSDNQDFIETFMVDKLEPRIHFTLNCGATSCPPVAYYSVERLDTELQLAQESFVTQTSEYNEAENVIQISELFKWFETDFGGKKGILDLLKKLELIPEESEPEITYSPYDWHLDIENY